MTRVALGNDAMLAEALLISERVARFRGESARAWRSRESERLVDPERSIALGKVLREQGRILIARGNLVRSEEKFLRAISIFESLEAPIQLGACYSALAVFNILFDANVASPLKIAGDLAAAVGENAAYELSLSQWVGLGREAEIEALREGLSKC